MSPNMAPPGFWTPQQEERFELVRPYYEVPGRYYHTMEHIKYMLWIAHFWKDRYPDADWEVIEWAILFHDCMMYLNHEDGFSDEWHSAGEAFRHLKDKVTKLQLRDVCRIVQGTQHHKRAGCKDLLEFKIVSDLDMRILAEYPPTYKRYAVSIALEWLVQGVDPQLYIEGRRKFLKTVGSPFLLEGDRFAMLRLGDNINWELINLDEIVNELAPVV